MNDTKERQNKILIIDDEPLNIAVLTNILKPYYTIHISKDTDGVVNIVKEHKPDVILLDILMPQISGFDVIVMLKEDEETKDIPVIFITALTQEEDEEKGFALGAADYIHKPFSASIVKLRIKNQIQIVNQMRTIHHLSMTDYLTGVSNRRHFSSRLSQEWSRSSREGQHLSLLLLDIDDFKQINDVHGHLVGDIIIQLVANVVESCISRSTDLVARWGGEEFAILLPSTPIDGAAIIAEKIRHSISNNKFIVPHTNEVTMTVSIGLNSIVPNKKDILHTFIDGVDKELYRAKKTGKNRVCFPL